jgi:hypothetical protein
MALKRVVACVFLSISLLTGCGIQQTNTPALQAAPTALSGVAHGGQQPVLGATVSIYEVGSTGYGVASTTPKATTTTSAVDGTFHFASNAYTCTASNTPMYLVVTGGIPGGYSTNANIALIAALPTCTAGQSAYVVVNEVTTAATLVALGQFMGTGLGAGTVPQIGATCTSCAAGVYNQGLVNAFTNTYPQLVDNATGQAVASSTSGSITITTEASKLNTIANVLSACVNSSGATSTTETTTTCGQLFTDVNETSASPRPADTIQAGLQMDLYPWYNVSAVYGLASPTSPFAGLGSTPNDWTVAISYAYPNMSVGVSGTSTWHSSMNLDIDTSGRIWFPSTQSGAVGVGYFDPSAIAFNGPYNSSGTPLVHPQFLAIDTVGYVWVTDIGGSYLEGFNTTSPSSSPTVLSLSAIRSGAIGVGANDELITTVPHTTTIRYATITSSRTSVVFESLTDNVAPSGAGVVSTGFGWEEGSWQFSSSGATSTESQCWVSSPTNIPYAERNSTNTDCSSGGAGTFHTSAVGSYNTAIIAVSSNGQFASNTIPYYTPTLTMSGAEGVSVDGNNQVWVANSGNSSITTYNFPYNVSYTAQVSESATVPYLHDATHGNTLTDPYAIGIDGSGNVWTISPGCVTTSGTACTPTGMVLTNLVGAASPTITPVGAQVVNNTVGTKPTS